MAKAAFDYPPDATLREAAHEVLSSALRRMMSNAKGTRAGLRQRVPTPEQVEALHDMRVGSRRIRAALSVFAKVFPRGEFRALEREVADITGALGAVRDADVLLDSLRTYQATLSEGDAYGIGRLIERQTKVRDIERERLERALRRLRRSRFRRRFQEALERAAVPERGKGKG
jgi:CHAD domain-containing protein